MRLLVEPFQAAVRSRVFVRAGAACAVVALVFAGQAPAAFADTTEHTYAIGGTRLGGGSSSKSDPVKLDPGMHLDYTVPVRGVSSTDEASAYYSINVPKDTTTHVSMAVIPKPTETSTTSLSIDAAVLDTEGETCGNSVYTSSPTDSTLPSGPAVVTLILNQSTLEKCAAKSDENAPEEGRLTVALSVKSLSSATAPDVEIGVTEDKQPSGNDTYTKPSHTTEKPMIVSLDSAQAKQLENTPKSGLGYVSATNVEPGAHTLTLNPGETRYMRVRLGYGQRLGVKSTVMGGKGAEEGRGSMTMSITDPVRRAVPLSEETMGDRNAVEGSAEFGESVTASTATNVRYLNAETEDYSALSRGGEYTVALNYTPSTADASGPVDVSLQLAVEGEHINEGPELSATEGATLGGGVSNIVRVIAPWALGGVGVILIGIGTLWLIIRTIVRRHAA